MNVYGSKVNCQKSWFLVKKERRIKILRIYDTSLPSFCCEQRAMSLEQFAHSSQLKARSLLFLNEAFYNFTIFCNDFYEVNSAVQIFNVNN